LDVDSAADDGLEADFQKKDLQRPSIGGAPTQWSAAPAMVAR